MSTLIHTRITLKDPASGRTILKGEYPTPNPASAMRRMERELKEWHRHEEERLKEEGTGLRDPEDYAYLIFRLMEGELNVEITRLVYRLEEPK